MQAQLAADRAIAADDVEYARRNARLPRQTGNAQGAERGFLRRFEDHAIAGGQGRRELPGGHQQGIVPRHHRSHHAQGLLGDSAKELRVGRWYFTVHLVDQFGKPAQAVNRSWQVAAAGVSNRFAAVQGLQHSQFIAVRLQQRRPLQQHRLARAGRQAGPDTGLEAAPRGSHCQVYVAPPHRATGASNEPSMALYEQNVSVLCAST
ncbi:hypothetical protein D3C77_448180 [compost metagenome]